MTSQANICSTCLCSDRRLFPVSSIRKILKEIKLQKLQKVKNICWECRSIIMKFYRFTIKAKNSQCMLNYKTTEHKSYSKLITTTKNIYDYQFTYNHNPLTNISEEKPELISIKQEIESTPTFDSFDPDSESEEKLEVLAHRSKNESSEERLKKKRTLKHDKKKEKDDKIKKYETVLLTEEELQRSREEKRNQPNYKKIPFKCDSCVLGFTRKENLDLHIEYKHNEISSPHICSVCATRFPSESKLSQHRSRHYVQFRCLLCQYMTSSLTAVHTHCYQKHSRDDTHCIHCHLCHTVLRTPKELIDHTIKEHSFICHDCGEKFKAKDTLRKHLIRIHSVKRQFSCDVCSRSFVTKTRLESHVAKHSQTLARRLAYCNVCDVQYKNIQVYRSHLRNNVKHALDRYACPDCDKKFVSKVYWSRHYNFFHLKKSRFKCEECDKLFISDWRLKNHRQTHHGANRLRSHVCLDCGKSFYTVSTLKGHQLTHSAGRQFMCEDCGDTFKQRPALYTHARRLHNK